jgi:putative endonuclease
MFFVYILKSQSGNGYYIGYTQNISKRFSEHNCGFASYTNKKGPWEIVYLEMFNSRSKALKREKQIKAFKGGNSFSNLINKKHRSRQDTQAVNEGPAERDKTAGFKYQIKMYLNNVFCLYFKIAEWKRLLYWLYSEY